VGGMLMTEQRRSPANNPAGADVRAGRRATSHRPPEGRTSSISPSAPRIGLWADHDPVPPERLSSYRCVAALALGMAEAGLDPHACAAELAAAGDRPLLVAAADHLDRVDHGQPEVIGRARNLVCLAMALLETP
jgi:hypothetical protein